MKRMNMNEDQELMAYEIAMMAHDQEQERHRQRRQRKQMDRDRRQSKWN